ncbi:ankyrin repeat protein [Penicillium cataractarum]|uniref:Ankyrin repeat protein n=1 Tax=Penicillium cataractarum TaxID=2100454 RepID=A0A9W9S0C2_9EURO|nr:ankyrin repeat protein [Penicillium cataractarum]KAJ5368329.1 ankyrin repeat protein [Penicillium cataractarum]
MAAQRSPQLPLEVILTIADFLQPSDLLNLLQTIPQIAPLLNYRHIQARDENNHTLLYLIVEQGLDNLIQPLTKFIPQSCTLYNEGWTPLHQAIGNANQRMVKALIYAGADLSAQDEGGKTALHLACKENAIEIVQCLLDHGANPSAVDHSQRTPLHEACGQNTTILRIVTKAGEDLNPRRLPRELTPLHHETMLARESLIRILLEAGADPSIPTETGETILHRAALMNHANIVRLLLEFGVDIAVRNGHGCTPFLVAAIGGSDECLQFLLKAGADISDLDNHGRNALHIAAWAGQESSVRLLLKLGLDSSARDKRGHTPMCWAAKYEQTGVVQILEDAQKNRFARLINRVRGKS